MATDNVSLVYELAELEDAVRAARLVVELLSSGAAPTPGQERRVATAAAASLHLVEARIHLVTRVVRGDALVAALAADHNRVQINDEDDEDMILRDRESETPRKRRR